MTLPSYPTQLPCLPRRLALQGVGALLAAASMPLLAAQPRPRPRFDQPAGYAVFNENVTSHRLSRRLLDIDDTHRYQVFIAEPLQTPPSGGFPVIYMLDGNAVFDRLNAGLLARADGLIIVGIGYPTDKVFDTTARARDYTPPLPQGVAKDARDRDRPVGGAPEFLDILKGPLRDEIERDLPVDNRRRAVWGHSYGGLFCLYTLLTRPDAFSRYIPVSSSSGWGDGLLQKLAGKAQQRDLQSQGVAEVLIMLGDSEARSGSPEPTVKRPALATMELIATLQDRSDLHVRSHVFEGLGHGATFAASFPQALALAAAN